MDISVLIPSRNEMFLARTIKDLIEHCEGDYEVIAVLDGAWASPSIPQHERVQVIYVPESIGQRAATNLGARLARGKYVVKLDAHCSVGQGWDVKMLAAFEKVGDDVTMTSVMRNLHAFDWRCGKCHWERYQGPTPERCPQCNERHHLYRKMRWIAKPNPQSVSYCFDSTPHFQYNNEYKRHSEYLRDLPTRLTETMSLQGSCFMLTRKRYWDLDICDENLGNWGHQGIEVACKSWLSGGRVLVNHNTYYGHLFRTQGGDFGFPYELPGRQVQKTRDAVTAQFWDQRWPKMIHPVSWLVEKFWPVPGWDQSALDALKTRETKELIAVC